jgi:hypothetical protein
MFKIFKKLFGKHSKELHFSYEEKKYSFGVKVLVALLTLIILMLSERAIVDLQSGIPSVNYPNYRDLVENRNVEHFSKTVIQPLQQARWQLESRKREARSEYDTSLLEQIAGEDERIYGHQDSVRDTVDTTQADLAKLDLQISQKQAELDDLREIARIAEEPLRREYVKQIRIRQLKVFLWEAIFWIPFFFITLWWYSRTKRKDSRWEIIAVAALIASSIISLQSFSIFLWSWIPKELLEKLWEILQATLLTRIVGYYLMMAVIILLLGGLIVSVHRRATDPVRGGKRKIRNMQCPTCTYPLDLSEEYCGGCGKQIKDTCGSCGKMNYTWAAVCEHCGKKKNNSN